jgi:hypothetical protein
LTFSLIYGIILLYTVDLTMKTKSNLQLMMELMERRPALIALLKEARELSLKRHTTIRKENDKIYPRRNHHG